MKCPICFSQFGHCPECGKSFEHGEADHCDKPACKTVNSPVDCVCGFVVAQGAKGILNYDMTFFAFTD